VAPGLVEQYNPIFGSRGMYNDKMNEFLSRVNPVIDPLTYSLSNDGQGPLHELHLPKNLLMLMIAGVGARGRKRGASDERSRCAKLVAIDSRGREYVPVNCRRRTLRES